MILILNGKHFYRKACFSSAFLIFFGMTLWKIVDFTDLMKSVVVLSKLTLPASLWKALRKKHKIQTCTFHTTRKQNRITLLRRRDYFLFTCLENIIFAYLFLGCSKQGFGACLVTFILMEMLSLVSGHFLPAVTSSFDRDETSSDRAFT